MDRAQYCDGKSTQDYRLNSDCCVLSNLLIQLHDFDLTNFHFLH